MPRLRIVNTSGAGFRTKIYIDDLDVSGCFNTAIVTSTVKDQVTAVLTAVPCDVEFDAVTQIEVDFIRELLIERGWTPPAEAPAELDHLEALNGAIGADQP